MSENKGLIRAWITVACAWLLGFAMCAPMLCIPPIVHIITARLFENNAAVGLLFAVPVTMLIALAIPSGSVAGRPGTKKAAGIGAAVMAAGSLFRGIFRSFNKLMIFTLIHRIGFSMVYPNLPKLVGLWFPREKVGPATGVYSTGITTAGAVALVITLPLVSRHRSVQSFVFIG